MAAKELPRHILDDFGDPVPGDSKKWRDYPYANLQLREATQGVYNEQSDHIFANNGNEDAAVINAMFDAYRTVFDPDLDEIPAENRDLYHDVDELFTADILKKCHDGLVLGRRGEYLHGEHLLLHLAQRDRNARLGPGTGKPTSRKPAAWYICPNEASVMVPSPVDHSEAQAQQAIDEAQPYLSRLIDADLRFQYENVVERFKQAKFTAHFANRNKAHWMAFILHKPIDATKNWTAFFFDSSPLPLNLQEPGQNYAKKAFVKWLEINCPQDTQRVKNVSYDGEKPKSPGPALIFLDRDISTQSDNWSCSLQCILNILAFIRYGCWGWDMIPHLRGKSNSEMVQTMMKILHNIMALKVNKNNLADYNTENTKGKTYRQTPVLLNRVDPEDEECNQRAEKEKRKKEDEQKRGEQAERDKDEQKKKEWDDMTRIYDEAQSTLRTETDERKRAPANQVVAEWPNKLKAWGAKWNETTVTSNSNENEEVKRKEAKRKEAARKEAEKQATEKQATEKQATEKQATEKQAAERQAAENANRESWTSGNPDSSDDNSDGPGGGGGGRNGGGGRRDAPKRKRREHKYQGPNNTDHLNLGGDRIIKQLRDARQPVLVVDKDVPATAPGSDGIYRLFDRLLDLPVVAMFPTEIHSKFPPHTYPGNERMTKDTFNAFRHYEQALRDIRNGQAIQKEGIVPLALRQLASLQAHVRTGLQSYSRGLWFVLPTPYVLVVPEPGKAAPPLVRLGESRDRNDGFYYSRAEHEARFKKAESTIHFVYWEKTKHWAVMFRHPVLGHALYDSDVTFQGDRLSTRLEEADEAMKAWLGHNEIAFGKSLRSNLVKTRPSASESHWDSGLFALLNVVSRVHYRCYGWQGLPLQVYPEHTSIALRRRQIRALHNLVGLQMSEGIDTTRNYKSPTQPRFDFVAHPHYPTQRWDGRNERDNAIALLRPPTASTKKPDRPQYKDRGQNPRHLKRKKTTDTAATLVREIGKGEGHGPDGNQPSPETARSGAEKVDDVTMSQFDGSKDNMTTLPESELENAKLRAENVRLLQMIAADEEEIARLDVINDAFKKEVVVLQAALEAENINVLDAGWATDRENEILKKTREKAVESVTPFELWRDREFGRPDNRKAKKKGEEYILLFEQGFGDVLDKLLALDDDKLKASLRRFRAEVTKAEQPNAADEDVFGAQPMAKPESKPQKPPPGSYYATDRATAATSTASRPTTAITSRTIPGPNMRPGLPTIEESSSSPADESPTTAAQLRMQGRRSSSAGGGAKRAEILDFEEWLLRGGAVLKGGARLRGGRPLGQVMDADYELNWRARRLKSLRTFYGEMEAKDTEKGDDEGAAWARDRKEDCADMEMCWIGWKHKSDALLEGERQASLFRSTPIGVGERPDWFPDEVDEDLDLDLLDMETKGSLKAYVSEYHEKFKGLFRVSGDKAWRGSVNDTDSLLGKTAAGRRLGSRTPPHGGGPHATATASLGGGRQTTVTPSQGGRQQATVTPQGPQVGGRVTGGRQPTVTPPGSSVGGRITAGRRSTVTPQGRSVGGRIVVRQPTVTPQRPSVSRRIAGRQPTATPPGPTQRPPVGTATTKAPTPSHPFAGFTPMAPRVKPAVPGQSSSTEVSEEEEGNKIDTTQQSVGSTTPSMPPQPGSLRHLSFQPHPRIGGMVQGGRRSGLTPDRTVHFATGVTVMEYDDDPSTPVYERFSDEEEEEEEEEEDAPAPQQIAGRKRSIDETGEVVDQGGCHGRADHCAKPVVIAIKSYK
ncbi:hypothetical protein QC762_207680 [Podospora pseudocomata]|uniref:Ubiquitin-like protease family profile domain-containing protein n=1 Tax=Podospora pseudocomata TaxID=2093779 RepID=A0ABR0GM70_9PEZI|nr:hypothetical protein QC762_207680 [Podospora pseudocomata]